MLNKVSTTFFPNDFLVKHSDSFPVKLLAGILLSSLVYMSCRISALPFSFLLAIIWLSLFFTERTPFIFGMGSLLYFLFSLKTTGILIFRFAQEDLPGRWFNIHSSSPFASPWTPFAIKIIVECITAVIVWQALRELSTRGRWNKLLFAFGLLLAPLFLFDYYSTRNPYLTFVLIAFIAIWVKVVWGYLWIANSGIQVAKLSIKDLWIVYPVWNIFIMPMWRPIRLEDLNGGFSSRAKNMRAKVIYFSACALFILFLDQTVSRFLFSHEPYALGLPNPWLDSVAIFLENIPSVFTGWSLVLFSFLRFILVVLGVFCSLPFLILMNSGVPAAASWSSPQRAKSFHEFSSRVLGFYVQINVLVFYQPINAVLGFLQRFRKLRVFVATFLSTFILAFLYHLIRYTGVLFANGFLVFTRTYSKTALFYDLTAALVTASSVLLALYRKPRHLNVYFHVLRLSIIFLLYGLMMTLIYSPQAETPGEKLLLWIFLLTGKR